MPILRKREIENLEQLSGEELEAFFANLPAEKEQLEDLFDYIDFKLEREECDHTLRFAMHYMMQKQLNFPKVTAWLNENGGYCDCKVLEEITSKWREKFDAEEYSATNGDE